MERAESYQAVLSRAALEKSEGYLVGTFAISR